MHELDKKIIQYSGYMRPWQGSPSLRGAWGYDKFFSAMHRRGLLSSILAETEQSSRCFTICVNKQESSVTGYSSKVSLYGSR